MLTFIMSASLNDVDPQAWLADVPARIAAIQNAHRSMGGARRQDRVQPWGTAAAKAPLAMPKNAATGRQYSGINILILWGAVMQHGFLGQSWLTFRQALSLGGNVRKDEL